MTTTYQGANYDNKDNYHKKQSASLFFSFPDTFFSPFLNGFNQFNTRFNPFGGRPPQQQQQQQPQQPQPQQQLQQQPQQFQQFPTSTQPFTNFAPQTGGSVAASPSGNFQSLRLGNSQVVTQNQQFGLTSQQQHFPSFAPQQPLLPQQVQEQQQQEQSQQQVQRPLQAFNRFPANTAEFTGPISTNFHTFGFPSTASPLPPITTLPSTASTAPQILSLPDLHSEPESPRSRVPITFPRQPEETQPEVDLTASRAPNRFRNRPPFDDEQSSEATPSGTRVLRVRPNRPSTEATRFGDDPVVDFNVGTESSLGTTPPPLLSRVRGRPIVPDDFPGPSQAIRGSIPADTQADDEETDEESTGPRGSVLNGRLRPGVRIVPTGNRARRPVGDQKDEEEDKQELVKPVLSEVERPDENPEQPRFSNSGRPINQISPSDETEDEPEDSGLTGTPRRRLRPVNRIPPGSSPSPPRRRLRPFSQDPSKAEEQVNIFRESFESNVENGSRYRSSKSVYDTYQNYDNK